MVGRLPRHNGTNGRRACGRHGSRSRKRSRKQRRMMTVQHRGQQLTTEPVNDDEETSTKSHRRGSMHAAVYDKHGNFWHVFVCDTGTVNSSALWF